MAASFQTPAPERGEGDDAPDPQELAMVEACKRGQQDAWTRLIQLHQDRLYSLCLRMVHDRDLASDLTQEAFVKIIQGIDTFDGRARLSTWMYRVTMNVCLSKLRSEKLRRHASLEHLTRETGDGADAFRQGDAYASRGRAEPTTGQSVQLREDRDGLLRALRELDPEQRAVLILCDCRGLSYDHVAQVMGVAVGTVKSRVFRARTALRDLMEAHARAQQNLRATQRTRP